MLYEGTKDEATSAWILSFGRRSLGGRCALAFAILVVFI